MATYQMMKMAAMRYELLKLSLAGAPAAPSAMKRALTTLVSKAKGKGAVLPAPNPAASEAYARLSRQGAAPGQLFHVPPGKSPFAP